MYYELFNGEICKTFVPEYFKNHSKLKIKNKYISLLKNIKNTEQPWILSIALCFRGSLLLKIEIICT